jgi:hypothetical protein
MDMGHALFHHSCITVAVKFFATYSYESITNNFSTYHIYPSARAEGRAAIY